MKVGSLVYATDSGLGILAKAFVDHGIVTHPLVVRHGRHLTHDEWFPGAPQITDLRSPKQRAVAMEFAAGMDAMLFFETPFLWELVPHCREQGVKTVIMPMHECMPVSQCRASEYQPDLWLCPSKLDLDWAASRCIGSSDSWTFLPVPVEVPWRQRTRAEVFVHNAGHGGLKGRNGTAEFIEALWYVRTSARFIVSSQSRLDRSQVPYDGDRIDFREGMMPYEELWRDGGPGDVFVFPEKFNGLSLPLQEARAAGMLVMGTDRFPMNDWLPTSVRVEIEHGILPDAEDLNPLIPVAGTRRNRIGPPYHEFDEAIIDPRAIAAKIDEWHGRDISEYSLAGKAWAEEHSWARLGPEYRRVLEALCQ